MPLLLRRSAPSPSVDELSLSVRAAPISASLNDCGRASGRCSLRRRRRSTNSTTTSDVSTRESADDIGDNQSILDNDNVRGSSKASSEFPEENEDELAGQEDIDVDAHSTASGDRARRMSSSARSHYSCACSKDSVAASQRSMSESALTSATVVIKENQLAVLDVEIGKMRRGLARKMYARICNVSRSLYRRKTEKSTTNNKSLLTN